MVSEHNDTHPYQRFSHIDYQSVKYSKYSVLLLFCPFQANCSTRHPPGLISGQHADTASMRTSSESFLQSLLRDSSVNDEWDAAVESHPQTSVMHIVGFDKDGTSTADLSTANFLTHSLHQQLSSFV